MSSAPIVIVGGGLAAGSATRALRKEGYDGEIVVCAAERHHPYERPPLSKEYLRGEADRSAAFHPDDAWYADNDVEVRTAKAVAGLDAAAHRITLADGAVLPYRRLLLATGSTARALAVPGADLRGVLTLRTVDDADRISGALEAAQRDGGGRLVVIGDGWIGMEVAASARMRGLEVTVLGRGAVPLKALGDEVGSIFARLHTENGVTLRTEVRVSHIVGENGRVTGVALDGGDVVPADVVVAGIGATPNVGLAAAAGIDILAAEEGGGVAVDGRLAASVPDVYAAGDIAAVPSRWGRPLRVEHWATALRTGAHAARAILGSDAAYARIPYFYSDQFDASLEYTGFVPGEARLVVSGDRETRRFAAFWVEDGPTGAVVHAGLTLNVHKRIGDIEKLITADEPVEDATLTAFVDDAE